MCSRNFVSIRVPVAVGSRCFATGSVFPMTADWFAGDPFVNVRIDGSDFPLREDLCNIIRAKFIVRDAESLQAVAAVVAEKDLRCTFARYQEIERYTHTCGLTVIIAKKN